MVKFTYLVLSLTLSFSLRYFSSNFCAISYIWNQVVGGFTRFLLYPYSLFRYFRKYIHTYIHMYECFFFFSICFFLFFFIFYSNTFHLINQQRLLCCTEATKRREKKIKKIFSCCQEETETIFEMLTTINDIAL